MKRFDAFYYGNAWVKGMLELDFGKPIPRFAFVADRAKDIPRRGRIVAEGRVEGFARKAELPKLSLAAAYKPPPTMYLVLISPKEPPEGLERTWLAFAVADPMAVIEAVAEHRG